MLRHRPFFVEGDKPLIADKKLLKAVINAFRLLDIYQPIGTISSLGIKESLRFLNYYKKDIKNRLMEKKLQDLLNSKTYIVNMSEKIPNACVFLKISLK
jgi:hypothetical protein